MVVDERGVFKEDNFQAAVAALTGTTADGKAAGGAGGKGRGGSTVDVGPATGATGAKSDIQRIVRMIMERNYDPVGGLL
jgi:ATP-dependent RNA helicase DOB1